MWKENDELIRKKCRNKSLLTSSNKLLRKQFVFFRRKQIWLSRKFFTDDRCYWKFQNFWRSAMEFTIARNFRIIARLCLLQVYRKELRVLRLRFQFGISRLILQKHIS